MSYQEQAVGNQLAYGFRAFSLLLVYLCLTQDNTKAGCRHWPCVLAVPLSLLGPVGALSALGIANKIFMCRSVSCC